MRLIPLAVAALAALAPAADRAEDGPPAADPAATDPAAAVPAAPAGAETPAADLTPEQAASVIAGVEADRRQAAAAAMPLPAAVVKQDAEAHAAIAASNGRGYPKLGLALGGGFPDLATASLLFRPNAHVRFFGGPTWGYVGWGLHAGALVSPWRSWITPTLSLEGGKLFRSDVSFLAKDSGGVPSGIKPILKEIDYQYLALDLGLELGSQRAFAFYLRLGLSYLSLKANGTATYESDQGSRVTFKDPSFHGILPSLKLGFQYWL